MDINKIKDFSKKYLDRNDPMHDFNHALRVYKLSMLIGRDEGADLDVLAAASFLHDIGMWKDRKNHEEVSIELSDKILEDIKKEKRNKIIDSIRSHRFSKNRKPKLLEAKIIQDADRLDALGAIGITRALVHSGYFKKPLYKPNKKISKIYDGESETVIDHFYEKLLNIKENLNTEMARKIAEERHKFMEEFLERFFKEWDGKK